jgi:hypothetical protein
VKIRENLLQTQWQLNQRREESTVELKDKRRSHHRTGGQRQWHSTTWYTMRRSHSFLRIHTINGWPGTPLSQQNEKWNCCWKGIHSRKMYTNNCVRSTPDPRDYMDLTKIHKDGVPLRPLLSNIGTHKYRLSKHLAGFLSHIIGNFEHRVKTPSSSSIYWNLYKKNRTN